MKQTRQPVSIGVDGGAVRRWWRLREKIKAAAPHQARVTGGGHKPLSETLEDLLYEKFVTKRTKKEKVTRSWLASMALTLYASEAAELQSPPPFAASDHWVSNFMRRFEISLRRRTNLTVLDDDVLVNRAVCYMSFLREQVPTIALEKTVLMDETAVYFEDARASTLDFTGLGMSSKLPPLLVWKGKAAPTFEKRSGPLYVAHQPRAWVDNEPLKKWIDLAFPFVVHGEGKCLVWDSMRAHISKALKAKCSARNIAMCVVPGGLTSYLQARDIGIYKSFNDLLYLKIIAWKQSDKVEHTRFGNPRMPSVDTVCGWVLRAWRDTEESTIMRSVEAAGFAQNPSEWFIAKHDVYGAKFREKWSENSKESSDEEDLFNLSVLDDALDDVNLLDE
ncbi:hypothetical protein PI124_g11373 [Phytophthora idaei]|nr:hypothetical protein PI124_g11373 [Phytophthora idaei]